MSDLSGTPVVDGPAADAGGDAALLARLRAGDGDAFEELVRLQTARLLGVARRLVTSEEDAREVVQETFVSAFRALGGFKGEARLSTWLHRIAVNTALMKLRAQRRRPEEPIEHWLPTFRDDGHHVERFQSWTESAERTLERADLREEVRCAIDRLPAGHRTVLLLRDIEEMEAAEVAALLGISTNAVKIRLHRARQALRALLAPHFQGMSS
jgi:RNA polymerase sigma-70 factor (ECF subfamily)